MGKIRGGTGNSAGRGPLVRILRFLRCDHDRLIGIKGLFLLLGAGEIAIDGGAGAKLIGAEKRLERDVDLADQVAFNLLPHLERFAGDLRVA